MNDAYVYEKEDNSYIANGILESKLFRIGFAMGLKKMSLIN